MSKGRSGDASQNSPSIGNVKKSNWRGHTSRSQSDFRGLRSQLILWSTTEGALSSPGVSVSQGSHMTLGRRIIIMQYPTFTSWKSHWFMPGWSETIPRCPHHPSYWSPLATRLFEAPAGPWTGPAWLQLSAFSLVALSLKNGKSFFQLSHPLPISLPLFS